MALERLRIYARMCNLCVGMLALFVCLVCLDEFLWYVYM